MIPCDFRQEARSGSRSRFALAGGDCRSRGIARVYPERLLGMHGRAWDTALWFLGWDRRHPDRNTAFLRSLRACG